MGKLVTPKTYLVGYTAINSDGLIEFLNDTGNMEFVNTIRDAKIQGLSDGEVLCSFYAKLCYDTLSEEGGKNENVQGVRGIAANLASCFDQGHGSVFEHCQINFAVHNCSRVFETELVRHRVGSAFSVRSGRYHRSRQVDLVLDPILEPVRKRLEALQGHIESEYQLICEDLRVAEAPRDLKKKLTSAARRIIPEGRAKDLGFSLNLRSIRHLVQVRTSRHSEWEIRTVFGQVYQLLNNKFPLLFYGAKTQMVDGLLEVSGMKMQPYDVTPVPPPLNFHGVLDPK